jgi:glucose/arabinose dehydrogenase
LRVSLDLMNRGFWGTLGALVVILSSGCYVLHHSSGGGQTSNHSRTINPNDIAVPPGYKIEVITTNLTFPTGVAFDQEGRPCVVESGYAYGEVWTTPRLLRIERDGRQTVLAKGTRNGPWNGVSFHEGYFYVAEGGEWEGGRILKITSTGQTSVLVDGLPSLGDHHTDGPVMGPDGWLYFGQGTASNSGVIGEDNADFGWLKRHPSFHDIPGDDIVLAGLNFETKDFIHGGKGKVLTGAFLPFGTPSQSNQVIRGETKCGGSILRVRPSGGDVEMVAWGFRNPFGLAFSADGKLFVTENAYDDRGSRPVWGAADVLWKVEPKLWYGWPDYCAGQPLADKMYKPPGQNRLSFVLAKHPNKPPSPVARFGVHASADGLDFARSSSFGHVGEAFVALFGDQAPTVGKVLAPVGFSVARVNIQNGAIEPFVVNKGKRNGPASRLRHGGLERPIAVRFNPAGDALYIVDFGVMNQEKKTSIPWKGTGVLWRVAKEKP